MEIGHRVNIHDHVDKDAMQKWYRSQKTQKQTDHRLLSYGWNMAGLDKLSLTCLDFTDNRYPNDHIDYISVLSGLFA